MLNNLCRGPGKAPRHPGLKINVFVDNFDNKIVLFRKAIFSKIRPSTGPGEKMFDSARVLLSIHAEWDWAGERKCLILQGLCYQFMQNGPATRPRYGRELNIITWGIGSPEVSIMYMRMCTYTCMRRMCMRVVFNCVCEWACECERV